MNLFKTNNARSKKIYKNIILSAILRGGSIAVSLLLLPLTIDYIDALQYGIWLTINSIVSWITFFDVGMSNGLRNRLTEALSKNKTEEARVFVSTTYAALFVIALVVFSIYWAISPFLDWRQFLNIPSGVPDDIQALLLIVMGTFCVQLVAQIIISVLTACHEPAAAGFILFLGQLGTLAAIYFLRNTVPGTLSLLTLTMTLIPISILIISSIILYFTHLKSLAPALSMVKVSYAKDIIQIGGAFFFIQIGSLVLTYTNNIIISNVIGPEAVTEYNVAFRLYSVVTTVLIIVVTPYWSAFTDAYAKHDFEWMKDSLKKLRLIWALLALIVLPVLYLLSEKLFDLWVGDSVQVPNNLSVMMVLYTIGHTALVLNGYLLNGIGKLRIQLYLYIIVCIINIPLAVVLGKLYGTTGVTAAGVIIFTGMSIVLWIQNTKVIYGKATGIWNN